jgi:hypothetical protein
MEQVLLPTSARSGALTTRLSGIEAMVRSFGGQLLAEPAAFVAMARAEAGNSPAGPSPGLADRDNGVGPLR